MDTEIEQPRLLPLLTRLYRDKVLENFEGVFVFTILLLLGFILNVVDHRLTFLNLYFLPILLAGYFLNARSAVLGSALSIIVVGYFVFTRPESFMQHSTPMTLYLYLVTWGSLLVLTGALVGKLTEQMRERFESAKRSLAQLSELQEQLKSSNIKLEERNLTLEGMKAKVEAVLHYTMDPAVAQLVINRQLHNEKRDLSVLFADLENFTAHMENVAPEVSVRDLNRLFTSMEPILSSYKGHIDKYIGDGLMAEFGVPYFSNQHALLATLAALKMQARMSMRDFPWKMRIGVSTGPALVGLMGSESRKNYTAIGDTVNLAARLQALCPIGGVCVDERTYAAVARWFHTRRIRAGLSSGEAQRLEDNLAALDELLRLKPRVQHCLRAAEICALLGEPERAVSYERTALELEPQQSDAIHRSIGQVLLSAQENAQLPIRGKRQRVTVFEILGLKDPIDDRARIPSPVARLYEQMAKAVRLPLETVSPLEAIEASVGHGQVTAALAAALAQALGLSEREKRDAFLTGFIHDIGKRNVPEMLLVKQARVEQLSTAEREQLRSHVREAAAVVRDLGLPINDAVLEAIYQHHERFDGGGYPDGIQGVAISLLARVIQLCDEYEALTAWRPYHEPWDARAALAEIERDAAEGKFDPKVSEVFLRMMRDGLGS